MVKKMLLNYELSQDIHSFNVITSKSSLPLRPYDKSLIYNLIYLLTKKTTFGLIITSSSKGLQAEAHLSSSEKLYLNLKKDQITIKYANYEYHFDHFYEVSKIRLNLKSLTFYNTPNDIIEEFAPHQISFKVRPHNTPKYYELTIPMTTDEVFDPYVLTNLDSAKTLKDLQKLYETYFKNYQSSYDYSNLPTILSIKELTQEGATMDSIHLKDGKLIYYEFNKIISDLNIRLSYNNLVDGPLITILGFNSSTNFDLDYEIRNLLHKAELFTWQENIKLIK